MIPLIVEPSSMCYDLFCLLQDKDTDVSDVALLADFVDAFSLVLEGCRSANVSIAMTESLYDKLMASVPFVSPDAPLFPHIRDYFYSKFSRQVKLVPECGDQISALNFQSGINPIWESIFDTDSIYSDWLYMLAGVTPSLLPAAVISTPQATIFESDRCLLQNTAGSTSKIIYVLPTASACLECPAVSFWSLALHLVPGSTREVACAGSNTHSSMWGKAVKCIDHVPAFERSLITAFAATGLVQDIKLGDFYARRPAAEEPHIEVTKISIQGDAGDVLEGLLVGRGKKQHAQKVFITVNKGLGELLIRAVEVCERQIDRQMLDELWSIHSLLDQHFSG